MQYDVQSDRELEPLGDLDRRAFLVERTGAGQPVVGLALRVLEADLDGIPVVIARTGWTAEVGFEIYLRDGKRGEELWQTVMEAGKPYNISPIGPCQIRRMEAGILNYGVDMTLAENPYEVGLDWMIDLEQDADFIGKEALKKKLFEHFLFLKFFFL